MPQLLFFFLDFKMDYFPGRTKRNPVLGHDTQGNIQHSHHNISIILHSSEMRTSDMSFVTQWLEKEVRV